MTTLLHKIQEWSGIPLLFFDSEETGREEEEKISSFRNSFPTRSGTSVPFPNLTRIPWWETSRYSRSSAPESRDPIDFLNAVPVLERLQSFMRRRDCPVIELTPRLFSAIQLLDNPDFSYERLAELIRHNPDLTGEFFRIVNSAVYSRGVEVHELKHGLSRMGRQNIKGILYHYAIARKICGYRGFQQLSARITDHCYATGVIADHLSRKLAAGTGQAFFAGLMHDIGKLVILKIVLDLDLGELIRQPNLSEELFDSVFTGYHEKTGEVIASQWKLSRAVLTAIRHHHDFFRHPNLKNDSESYALCCLVNLSDAMTRLLGKGRRIGNIDLFRLPAARELGFEPNPETIAFLESIPELVLSEESELVS